MDKTVQLQEVEVQQRDKTLSTNGETKQQQTNQKVERIKKIKNKKKREQQK